MVLPLVTTGRAAILPVLLLAVPIALIDGIRRYGWKLMLFFAVETLLISNFFENLSVETGFPFGQYHYTGGPQLIHVPIYIGPVYFGLGYLCWRLAGLLLAGSGRRAGDVVAVPALAAVLMTAFDLGSDSVASTVNGIWVWERGGGVFGVPYTNYLGWWFVTWLFFQVFALCLVRRPSVRTEATAAAAPIVYAALAANAVSYFVTADDITITDPSGAVWSHQALAETMMTINLFIVLPLALLSLRSSRSVVAGGSTIGPRAVPGERGGQVTPSGDTEQAADPMEVEVDGAVRDEQLLPDLTVAQLRGQHRDPKP